RRDARAQAQVGIGAVESAGEAADGPVSGEAAHDSAVGAVALTNGDVGGDAVDVRAAPALRCVRRQADLPLLGDPVGDHVGVQESVGRGRLAAEVAVGSDLEYPEVPGIP